MTGSDSGAGGPIVQVSIDVFSVEEAIAVGNKAVRAGVDWLEVGTPLLIFQGMGAIGRFAEAFPGKTLFADLKLVDGARKYVVAAAKEGAHLVTICGVASDASIRAAIEGGKESRVRVVVDLYATPDKVRRAVEVEAMGADLVYLHYGGDQRAASVALDDSIALLPVVKRALQVPVGVVTFDIEGGVAAVEAGADVVLVGHPFLTGPESEGMLTEYVRRVREAYQRRVRGG